jgi:hypothetical protein
LGILDTVKAGYSDMTLDANTLQNELANSENIALLRDILEKLG